MKSACVVRFCLALAACLVLGVAARADEKTDPTGTWKWEIKRGEGKTVEVTLKLKVEGEKATGTVVGRDGKDYPIGEGTFKDGTISFQVVREFKDQKFTSKYKGKFDGDTIKGKLSTDFGGKSNEIDWNAKRAK